MVSVSIETATVACTPMISISTGKCGPCASAQRAAEAAIAVWT